MARLALLAILFLTNNLNKIMMMFNKRISFLNGKFIDHQKAFVHIEDRGFQFGDGFMR